ncbi:Inner membrane protein YrbG, predicted calcium/sodium:proton antiporter [hydrothermal vent metagenome]|uniref:Inner membrane protein YrbG, predicted calcium/sodium:proton antiporter n=1 Tax=hydrothermal vent metagenome TaxID=652676 RepID=A0A3B1AC28_9ZZZZ
MLLTQYIIAIIGGFIVLVWGADRFVYGAAGTARNIGVSTLVIGLTVVGFGTSAPEILVSVMAALEGSPGIAVGNAIGSNIANIALVLGVTALVSPLLVNSKILKREFPIMLFAMFVALFLLYDLQLSWIDGLILMSGIVAFTFWLIKISKGKDNDPSLQQEFETEIPHIPLKKAILWTLAGLVLLLISSQILVYGAVNIAKYFGVSDLIIGLTIIAIGTSLPELATSVMSAIKKEHDMAIGNIIGSNMFNLLAVLGIPAMLVSPIPLTAEVISRDYMMMLGLSIVLFIFAYGFRGPGRINRIEGGLLLLAYFAYMGTLYMSVAATHST